MAKPESGSLRETWELAKTLFWAIVIAIGVRTFAFEPFNIPSGSMIPTLLIGDYLFVSKTAYGYSKYSFPWGLAPFEGRVWEGAPKRGDVVVFRPPGDPDTDFIKRVIGLPGDRVQMKQGVLYINGTAVERKRIEDFQYNATEGSAGQPVPQYLETLPGGVTHPIIETQGDTGQYDNTPVYVVPQGDYFMMGDNRDNSNDSRVWRGFMPPNADQEISDPALLDKVGFVPAQNLIGPAKILFWSYDDSFKFTNPITWVTALRWQRLLNLID
ncbi:signal peptidase I [Dongia sedimenti]|uniref:Signal peptidase I n=1 Tax=Dongia sedimenti TaxID=3064282 RepID=A0ABU0YSQ4_9PROT|nr:signal peptidase I [Rhodospirillaceae bacterium R-7]